MGRRYDQLSLEQRCEIARLQADGRSVRQIAAALDRSPSTISREITRNQGRQVGYKPSYAEEQTRARRWSGSRLEREPGLRRAVMERLARGWSPEQIAGRLARETGRKVISYESIYRFVHAQIARTKDYSWRHYLPRGKSKRGFRGRKGGSSANLIEGRVSLAERPPDAADRKTPGHWEADLMLFSRYGQAVLTVHERTSRLLLAVRPINKAARGSHAISSDCLAPCRSSCAGPLPSTTAPSLPGIPPCIACRSQPSSVIATRPGKRAASRTPSAACDASCHARPISPPCLTSAFARSSPPTTARHANALTSGHPQRPSPNCCTSNVNSPDPVFQSVSALIARAAA